MAKIFKHKTEVPYFDYKNFKGNEQIKNADVSNGNAQYLYNDGSTYYFMDEKTFEQHEVTVDIAGDQARFLKEGDRVQTQSFNNQVISVELPKNVYLEVT